MAIELRLRSAQRTQEAVRNWTEPPRRWLAIAANPRLLQILEILRPLGWLVLLAPILLALLNGLPFALGNNATLSLNLAGSFAVHMSLRPSRKDILATAVIAGVLRALYLWLVGPIGPYFGSTWISWGSFLGLASLLTLGVRALSTRDIGRPSALKNFWAASLFLYGWVVLVFALNLTPHTLPGAMDRFLYAFDGSLGFEPSFAAGRVLAGMPLLQSLTIVQYQALMLGVAIVYGLQSKQPIDGSPRMLPAFVSMMIAGYCLYHLCPAAGPVYGFGPLFPQRPPEFLHMALVRIPIDSAARNAMPSLHIGTALLIWWHSRGSHWVGRLLAGLFLLATAFSTMATGQHYFIDLVVAFPFTMAVQVAWARLIPITARARYLPLVTGTSITFAWLALLRFGTSWMFYSPVLPWLLVASTVIYSLSAEMKLNAACRKMTSVGSGFVPCNRAPAQV